MITVLVHMQVGPADSTGEGLDQHLSRAWNGVLNLLDKQRLVPHYDSFHGIVPY